MLSHTFSVEQNWIYLLHEIKKISDLEPKNNLSKDNNFLFQRFCRNLACHMIHFKTKMIFKLEYMIFMLFMTSDSSS